MSVEAYRRSCSIVHLDGAAATTLRHAICSLKAGNLAHAPVLGIHQSHAGFTGPKKFAVGIPVGDRERAPTLKDLALSVSNARPSLA
jgi:hypothetical protein